MRAARLQNAIERLTAAIPRRRIRTGGNEGRTRSTVPLTSSSLAAIIGTRTIPRAANGDMAARLSFDTAWHFGFRGSLDEWERLMGAVARR